MVAKPHQKWKNKVEIVYSPDGEHIAMVNGDSGVYRIAILNRRSGSFTILTDTRLDESPSFSPNGHMIIYTHTGGRGTELAAVSVDGYVHQRLALQDRNTVDPCIRLMANILPW